MIDKLAHIHPGASIADDVKIEAFATIYEDVEIGSGSWIGPNSDRKSFYPPVHKNHEPLQP